MIVRTLSLAAVLMVGGLSVAEASGMPGEAIFRRCGGCHQVGPEARNGVGPQLNGIIGREAGTAPEFNYSDAFKAKVAAGAFTWDRDSITAYIANPPEFLGARGAMPAQRLNPQQVSDLLDFLATTGQ